MASRRWSEHFPSSNVDSSTAYNVVQRASKSWEGLIFAHFKEYQGNHNNFKSLYDFGGRCLKIRDVCMDFEPYFKVHSLVSVRPKSIMLGQMTNLNTIFHVVVSVYRFGKIWNSPQFPAGFRNGQWCLLSFKSFSQHAQFWKLEEYSWTVPSFSCEIFGHVTCLDQSRASENIWWLKDAIFTLLKLGY